MLFNQLIHTSDDVMNDDDVSWSGGQPMPGLVQQQEQETIGAQKVVYPGQAWVANGEEDIYGIDDEDSPCSIYYSRVANYL